MSSADPHPPRRKFVFRSVEGLVVAAIAVILAGLVVPTVRTWRFEAKESRARADLQRIRAAVLRFLEDVGHPPTRGRSGADGTLYCLLGPGVPPDGTYFASEDRRGFLLDHLVRNRPRRDDGPGYEGWKGPYLDRLGSDPWGDAYVVVVYPLDRDDDRDCVVVSAGRNGLMDGNYASVRDPVAVNDDLVEVIVDKSPAQAGPVR